MTSLRICLIAALATVCSSIPRMMHGRHHEGFVLRQKSEQPLPRASNLFGQALFPDQILDHFDSNNTATWTQRYFFNYESANSDINLLYIEGEGTASIYSIYGDNNPIVQYAKEFAAAMYTVEHRFYGMSQPTADISVNSLKYLTSQQALEDLATFIKYINSRNGNQKAKWIVIGGSYSGSLALWMRQLHPELVIGALGASGPVLAQLDFYGYLQAVEDDINDYDARHPGARRCANQIELAFDNVIQLMQSADGRAVLDQKFNNTPTFGAYASIDENVQSLFYQALIGNFMGASQYGGLGEHTLDYLCDIMTTVNSTWTEKPIDRLARTVLIYGPGVNVDANYTEMVEQTKFDNWSDFDTNANRAWTWQTCNEFGYFQTTDKGSSIFRSTVPSNFYLNLCIDVFGIGVEQVKKNIDKTNAYYGERNYYKGTNVVITHGTQDPWHWLTKQDSQHESVVISYMKGGIHCRDLYLPCLPPNKYLPSGECNADVNITQALTVQNFRKWIRQYEQEPTSITITDRVGQRPQIYNEFHSAPLAVTLNAPNSIRKIRSIAAKKDGQKRKWNVFTGRSDEGLLRPPLNQDELNTNSPRALPSDIIEAYLDQPWDHFDNTNPNVFNQRYFVNGKYGSSNGPNFLMIGGEGPESNSWVTRDELAWVQYAKKEGANLFLLEHRYYGASKLKTNDLQYLTSAQMLYDVASFINMVKRENNATGPWITFGGSYSGALSAWAREWFPELIIGAVGSSGPVEAKNDFYEYLMVVEKVLRSSSEACANRTQDVFTKLQQLSLTPDGRKTISDKFKLSPPWNNTQTPVHQDDIFEVFSNLYGYFQNVVQYSDDNNAAGNKQNVSTLCGIMTDQKYADSFDAMKAVMMWEDVNETLINSDFSADIAYYRKLLLCVDGNHNDDCKDVDDGHLAGILWTWQTCNEFGYYQTTDYGKGIFGNPVPLNFFVKMCEKVFDNNKAMEHLEKAIGRTIYQYGGRKNYKGTNVVLPNGNHDPWHALGLLDATGLDSSVVPIIIEGTAHCADMYPARDSDPQSLVDARNTISDHIHSWLTNTTVTITSTAPPPPTGNPVTQHKPNQETTTEGSSGSFSLIGSIAIAIFTRILFQ